MSVWFVLSRIPVHRTATPLTDGRILVTGGDSGFGYGQDTTELWTAVTP